MSDTIRSRALVRAPLLIAVAAAAVAVVTLVGCGTELASSSSDPTAIAARSVQAQLEADLKAVRQATAKYHSFEQSQKDDYTFLFLNACMVDDPATNRGGMGYHYVNTNLLGGSLPDITKPQALLYEPAPNGSLKLVAVEYVIPVDAWTGTTPPYLLGQEMKPNKFGLYALHVWLYKSNPSGMFADWNPAVNCDNAPAAMRGGHH